MPHDSAPRLLHEIVERAAADAADAPAVHAGDTHLSFGQLWSCCRRAATVIDRMTEPGGRVAVVGENHPAWLQVFGGASLAGRTVVLLNHRLAAVELATILRRSGATALVGQAAQIERMRSLLPDTAVATVLSFDEWSSAIEREAPFDGLAADTAAAPAWIIYTSGTTGAPKGAILTHASILAAIDATHRSRPIEPDDVYLFPFSLGHVAAYNVLRHHSVARPVVLVPKFDAAHVTATIQRHGVTSMSVAATMLAALLDHLDATGEQVPTLRSLAYGAAPMPAALLRRAAERLGPDVGFAQGYGMTELSGNAAFLDPDGHRAGLAGDERMLHGAGYAAPGVELRIAGPDRRALPPGQAGEVLVRAPQAMAGYLDDPEASALALAEGWLHTGDLGRLDEDGLLTIVDRIKDVIVTGGENVSSLEVEDALRSHPTVTDVAVVGVPDPVWGENVCAVVVAGGQPIDATELTAHVRPRLAGFKVPRHVVVVAALPVNAAGKVQKADLRAWLRDEPHVLGPRL